MLVSVACDRHHGYPYLRTLPCSPLKSYASPSAPMHPHQTGYHCPTSAACRWMDNTPLKQFPLTADTRYVPCPSMHILQLDYVSFRSIRPTVPGLSSTGTFCARRLQRARFQPVES